MNYHTYSTCKLTQKSSHRFQISLHTWCFQTNVSQNFNKIILHMQVICTSMLAPTILLATSPRFLVTLFWTWQTAGLLSPVLVLVVLHLEQVWSNKQYCVSQRAFLLTWEICKKTPSLHDFSLLELQGIWEKKSALFHLYVLRAVGRKGRLPLYLY